jgi:hypothetical protein
MARSSVASSFTAIPVLRARQSAVTSSSRPRIGSLKVTATFSPAADTSWRHIRLVPHEDHPAPTSQSIVILRKSIGAHVPVKDKYLHDPGSGRAPQGIFYGALAANARTVWIVWGSRPDALNHRQGIPGFHAVRIILNQAVQLNLSGYRRVLSKTEYAGERCASLR